ncbi:hypothetical protein HN958_02565 [Candidatus Falkowbacteria bacterium]|jgi:hypothetical protein|nr:hypothetical protein [Candidatus Falkowbacteria bacterium]
MSIYQAGRTILSQTPGINVMQIPNYPRFEWYHFLPPEMALMLGVNLQSDVSMMSMAAHELLLKNGIPTFFVEAPSINSHVVHSCTMLPFEVVMRRYPGGRLIQRDNCHVYMFDHEYVVDLLDVSAIELYLLTEQGKVMFDHCPIPLKIKKPLDGLDSLFVSFTAGMVADQISLLHSTHSDLQSEVMACCSLVPFRLSNKKVVEMFDMAVNAFKLLEAGWARADYTLIDLRLRFGFTQSGKLVIASVIDSDSVTLILTNDRRSKETLRYAEYLSAVSMRGLPGFIGSIAQCARQFFPEKD